MRSTAPDKSMIPSEPMDRLTNFPHRRKILPKKLKDAQTTPITWLTLTQKLRVDQANRTVCGPPALFPAF